MTWLKVHSSVSVIAIIPAPAVDRRFRLYVAKKAEAINTVTLYRIRHLAVVRNWDTYHAAVLVLIRCFLTAQFVFYLLIALKSSQP